MPSLRPYPRAPESESTLEQDPVVIHMPVKVENLWSRNWSLLSFAGIGGIGGSHHPSLMSLPYHT